MSAESSPRSKEWWLSVWEIESKVWPLTQGQGVTVGLIDTGVEATIPQLKGVVLPGTDFEGAVQGRGDGRKDVDREFDGHGTSMAVLIAGQGPGDSMVGVAPKAKILPIQVTSEVQNDEAIRFAVDHGAKVINLSLGAPHDCITSMQDAVNYAISKDVVVVAGAGNSPNDGDQTPADCKGVLAVGGLDYQKRIADFSSPGKNIMVAAPAVMVGVTQKDGSFRERASGTSQASALTSGVIALLRARFPQMSGRQIVQRILNTTKDVGPKGWDNKTGNGAVIPYAALTANVFPGAANPVYGRYDQQLQAQKGGSPQAVNESKGKGVATKSTHREFGLLVVAAVVLGLVTFIALFMLRQMKTRGVDAGQK
ncbi:S8 family serine peptidase [Actinomadura barringtoniae]|uniref:S8 family serine peptidase n=1 Tax=Actinomadura barringtoniae TaxID=1427535 RepID=A0A939PCR1_9ACTN|nr:S8 family serine peptidase [Actinomadura barringtoniae]MBO2447269.1 S8 family serine peptidase [Actinomadura barringtoniae]